MGEVVVRHARTADVRAIKGLVDSYSGDRKLLAKATVTLYEDVQEFWVAEDPDSGEIVGCGALHVLWEDLAEVRTIAVDDAHQKRGIGSAMLSHLVDVAIDLGIKRLFCLTFAVGFFGAHGFVEIEGTPVDHDTYAEMLQSYDEGVAEFLDLERVKPNTLGNTRMLRIL